MIGKPKKLLTVITEAAIEQKVVADLMARGARGFTVTDARGRGSRGVRDSRWETGANVRIEVLCDEAVGQALADHLRLTYYEHFAMVVFFSDVEVLRPDKF